jgi:hypothetical protein
MILNYVLKKKYVSKTEKRLTTNDKKVIMNKRQKERDAHAPSVNRSSNRVT